MQRPLVSIGADHRGFKLKQVLMSAMSDWGFKVNDVGAFSARRIDFPPMAFQVAESVAKRPKKVVGVLLCGSGIGVAIAANKVKGVRAALVMNQTMAKQAVTHDRANVLVLPADFLTAQQAQQLLKAFLHSLPDTDSAHKRRVAQITAYERRVYKSNSIQ